MAAMAFEPSTNQDVDITADVSITDADGEEITGTLTFDVTPVNDAPTATNTTQTELHRRRFFGSDERAV